MIAFLLFPIIIIADDRILSIYDHLLSNFIPCKKGLHSKMQAPTAFSLIWIHMKLNFGTTCSLYPPFRKWDKARQRSYPTSKINIKSLLHNSHTEYSLYCLQLLNNFFCCRAFDVEHGVSNLALRFINHVGDVDSCIS